MCEQGKIPAPGESSVSSRTVNIIPSLLGGVGVILLLVGVCCCVRACCQRRKKKDDRQSQSSRKKKGKKSKHRNQEIPLDTIPPQQQYPPEMTEALMPDQPVYYPGPMPPPMIMTPAGPAYLVVPDFQQYEP
jgi:hypothetical protein